jgi:hypothetical protein
MSRKLSIAAVILLIVIFVTDTFGHEKHDTHEMPAEAKVVKHGHLKTFGPGEPPHFHKLDLSRFERAKNIAKAPSDIPPPINRKQPATLNLSLHVKEVV